MSGASEFDGLSAIQRSRRLSATRRASSGAGYPTGTCRRVFASAHQRRGRKHRSGTSPDQVNAIATKPEQSRIRPATVTARKLLEANSSRMVHHLSLGNAGHRLDYRAPLLEQNDCPVAQSKGFPPRRSISTAGDVFMQHLFRAAALTPALPSPDRLAS
jgi:hypothetical protein